MLPRLEEKNLAFFCLAAAFESQAGENCVTWTSWWWQPHDLRLCFPRSSRAWSAWSAWSPLDAALGKV